MFSSIIMHIALVAMTFTLTQSAPVEPLDAATLLENGQNAQRLNVLFQTLDEKDACNTGDKACLSDGVAACVDGKWAVGQGSCSASQKCFALPSRQAAGTLVTCTGERSALSAIDATGASGGIFGSANSTSTTTEDEYSAEEYCNADDDDCECEDDRNDTSTSANPKATSARATPERVTVTVTITAPTTLPPTAVTRTLSPEQASKVLSSAIEGGGSIIETPVSSSSPVITATAATVITTSAQQPSVPAPTITL